MKLTLLPQSGNYADRELRPGAFKKMLLVMKLTAFILLVALIQISAKSPAQTVTISRNNISLGKVFRDIHKQTGYNFLCTQEQLSHSQKVSLNLKNAPLREVLDFAFRDQPLTYSILNKTIIVKHKKMMMGQQEFAPLPPPIHITGTITDSATGDPLVGVTIQVKGNTIGTTTDVNGHFSLEVEEDAVLVISYLGYNTKEILVNEKTSLNITLSPATTGLNQLVVVGYGEQRKRDLTGSLSQINNSQLTSYPTTNIVQALSGRASGVRVIQNDGSPGSPISVRIRGTNSIQGNGEPLYVIDGFPISGNPTTLNNANIKSIDVLKDASATAIYGSRGANGVVLITTKGGQNGNTKVTYDGSYSIQTIRKKLKLMTPIEYGKFYNEQAETDNVPDYFTEEQLNELKKMGKGTDWQDLILQKAPMQSHTLSVSGGSGKTQFYTSGSLLKQDGIIKNSYYNRYSYLANLKHEISNKFTVKYSIQATRIEKNQKASQGSSSGRGNSLMSGAISVPPSIKPYNSNGSFTVPILVYPFISNAMINPLNYIYAESNINKSNDVLGNAAIIYKPNPYFTIRISGGIENIDTRNDLYKTHEFVNSDGEADVSTTQFTSILNENTITYSKDFGEQSLSILGGVTYQNFLNRGEGIDASGFVSDVQETNDLGAASVTTPPSSFYNKSVLISYLARINYSYKSKYLFTANFRSDGSSKYSTGSKWGMFPSGALAWRISKENFLKKLPFISDAKLRLGFGVTGSQAIAPYATLNQLVSGKTVFGNELFTTYTPSVNLAGNLKWETTLQKDIGLDLSFLDGRFSLVTDYYIKETSDLLNTVQLPASLGYTSTLKNVGKIQNKGIELEIVADILPSTSKFQWNLSGNISFNRNKVVKLYNGQDILGTSYYTGAVQGSVNLLREGQPVGIFYGYEENGYDNTGNIVYKDLNDDGKITNEDKTYIGNPNPKYIFGLSSAFSWHSFKLSVFFEGVQGNDIFNYSATNSVDLNQGMNLTEDEYLHHWTSSHPNQNAKYPALTKFLNIAVSNRFVEDGSYVRLKNIMLTYDIHFSKNKSKWLTDCQVYLSGQNLLTLTHYSWYDPSVNSHMGSNSINLGIDQYSYPTAKSITIGIKIGM